MSTLQIELRQRGSNYLFSRRLNMIIGDNDEVYLTHNRAFHMGVKAYNLWEKVGSEQALAPALASQRTFAEGACFKVRLAPSTLRGRYLLLS